MSDILTNISDTISGLARRIRQLEAIEIPVIGGGGAGAPSDASYLVLALHAGLTAERRFVDGTDLTGTDLGANSTYTLNHDDTAVAPATYGDATHVPQITINQRGHITKAADILITGVAPAVHNVLDSTYHGDVLTGAITRGDILYGNATPKIARLAKGTALAVLTCDANDTLWSAYFLSGTAGQTYTFSATGGTVPTGSGTANYVTRWATATTLGNSIIRDDGTTASIGTAPSASYQLQVIGSSDIVQFHALGFTTQTNEVASFVRNDGATNTINNVIRIGANSTGAPAAGLGASLLFTQETSGAGAAIDQNAARVASYWSISNHATRRGCLLLSAYDESGMVTGVIVKSSGGGATPLVGIGNFSATVEPVSPCQVYNSLGLIEVTSNMTDSVAKSVRITATHYNNAAEEAVLMMSAVTGAASNLLYIGGGLAIYNTVSQISMFTAATTTTTTGTEWIRIRSDGIVTIGSMNPVDTQVGIIGARNCQQLYVKGFTTQTNPEAVLVDYTAATNTVRTLLRLDTQSSGVAANGLGAALQFYLQSSTTASQAAGQIATLWIDATHATRTSAMPFYLVNSAAALAEVGRWTVGGLTIGGGVAATDYTLTFNGETTDGVLTWMEDEDWFLFGDAVKTDNGRYRKITTYTDTCNVLVTDEVVIFNKATAFTATMPAAIVGQDFYLKNIGAGNVTLSFPGVDTVDEVDSDPIMTQYDALHLVCRAANAWVKV